MPDATTSLVWLVAVASTCLGVLVSKTPTSRPALPSYPSIPWWQNIASRYELKEEYHAAPSYPSQCLGITLAGEGFHRRISYHFTCSLGGLLSNTDLTSGKATILQPLPAELFVDPYELDQLKAVQEGSVNWELFGHVDLEQPAPACKPTVLALTVRNVTKSPQESGPAVEIPVHAKYPAPVITGCASSNLLPQFRTGPSRMIILPAPMLLLRTEPERLNPGHHQAAEDSRCGGSNTSPDPETSQALQDSLAMQDTQYLHMEIERQTLPAAKPEALRSSCQRQPPCLQVSKHISFDNKPQWSLIEVPLTQMEMISIPAGCMLHAGWVSLVTLLSALLCSGAVIAATLY